MGKPAARITDMHVCPMQTPAVVPIPHVGGPIVGPGCPTVLIGGMPAAVLGDMCICVGPPDSIILGSTGARCSSRGVYGNRTVAAIKARYICLCNQA